MSGPVEFALLPVRRTADPVAWSPTGEPVHLAALLQAARCLAAALPDRGPALNLCADRLAFLVALLATAMRGQVAWMPGNARPATLAPLRAQAAEEDPQATPYLLTDDAGLQVEGLPTIVVPRWTDGGPQTAADEATPQPRLPEDFEWVRLFTSGSTGQPQPHGKHLGSLHRNIAGEAERLAQWFGRPHLGGVSVVATVPPQHSYGFESSIMLALIGGATLDTAPAFYPADIAAALAARARPRLLVTTPFHLKTLLDAGVALPPVDLVLSATAPLSPQLAARAEGIFGGRVGEIYGCTEAGQVAARLTTDGPTWTTLGELRLHQSPGDLDEHGSPRSIVQGGHVLTPTPLSDVLSLHDATRFELLGRSNDIVHVAGKRSSMAQLNFELNRLPGVEDGAFWLPDDEGGSVAARPVAFVVAPAVSAAAIVAALRERIEPAFVPRRVVQVTALPREATGKLTRQALAQLARQHLSEHRTAGWTVPENHPAFDGHFPGAPVLPGAVLLGWVVQQAVGWHAGRDRLGAAPRVEQLKFLAPVLPGQAMSLRLDTAGSDSVDFEVTRPGATVARGRLARGLDMPAAAGTAAP